MIADGRVKLEFQERFATLGQRNVKQITVIE